MGSGKGTEIVKVKQLRDTITQFAAHHERVGCREHAEALTRLASILAKLPQSSTVAKALKKGS